MELEEAPMKVHIDIDCTPEEARSFLGLPDVQPVQAAMMHELEQRLKSAMQAMDPETLMKTWLPAGIANMEQMQRMFWQQFGGGTDKK
jgi:Tfp pilus assembly PilM family ATPase